MATTRVTCFNDHGYKYDGTTSEGLTELLVGADYAGAAGNFREQLAALQFALPQLNDQNITSAKLYLYVKETKRLVEIEPQFWDIRERITTKSYNTFLNLYENSYVESGSETKAFDADNIIYNAWVSLDITGLVIGNNNNQTFSVVLRDIDHEEWGNVPALRHCVISSIEGGSAPYIIIEHENATPFRPTILYPDGDVVGNSGNLTFRWKYNAGVSAGQAKYEFGWRMQSAIQWNTTTVSSANQQHTMNAALFANGIVEWRVRTYNQLEMASEYSMGQFYVVGKPGNPVITGVKNDALTEITWSAQKTEESSARIRIIKDGSEIYNSGIISGGIEDAHRPNIILPNGTYSAILSIANIYDLWSDPVPKAFTINRIRPAVPVLKAQSYGDYVELYFTGDTNIYYIYRAEEDGEFQPICRLEAGYRSAYMYQDFAVKSGKKYRYYVRAYNGGIADSHQADVYVRYDGYYLSCVADMKKRVSLILSESEEYIPLSIARKNENYLLQYLGRKYPVKEAGEFASCSLQITAFIYRKEAEKLNEIMGMNDIFCIRGRGILMFADISSAGYINAFFDQGFVVSLTLEKLDYDGVISYV